MKLKLNKALRAAVMACCLAVAANTVRAASIEYGSYGDDLKANVVYANSFNGTSAEVSTISFGNITAADGVGTLGGLMRTDDVSSTFNGTGLTISMDVSNLSMGAWSNLLSFSTNASGNQVYQLQKNGGTSLNTYVEITSDGQTSMFANADNYTRSNGMDQTGILTTSLSHSTITVVYSATADTIAIYLDGSLMQTTTFSYNEGTTANKVIDRIALGGTALDGGGRVLNSAKIDNLTVWNTSLTDMQVQSLIKAADAIIAITEGATTSLADTTWKADGQIVEFNITATPEAGDVATLAIGSEGAPVTVSMAGQNLSVNGGAMKMDIAAGSTLEAGNVSLSGTSASLAYSGAGTLKFVNDAAFNDNTTFAGMTGTIEIAAGKTLSMGNSKTSEISLGSAKVVLNEGSTLSMFANTTTLGNDIEMNNSTILAPDGQDSYTLSGAITLNGANNQIATPWGKTFNLNGLISGEGSIIFQRTSNNEIAVANLTKANTYKGTTTINGAFKVVLEENGSLGEGGLTMAAAHNKYGELAVNTDATVHGISGTGKISIGAGKTLTLDTTSSFSRGGNDVNINLAEGGALKLASGVTLSGYDSLTITGKNGGEGQAKAIGAGTGTVELATGSGALTYENVVLTIGSSARNVNSKFVDSDLVFNGNSFLNFYSSEFSIDNFTAENANAITMTGTGSINGTLTVGRMVSNTGNLTFNGSVAEIADYANFDAEEGVFTDTTGANATSGYLTSNFTIIKSSGTGTITAGADMGAGLIVRDNNLLVHAMDTTNYVINEEMAYAGSDAANVTEGNLKVADGHSLSLTSSDTIATGVTVSTEGTGKVSVSGGAANAIALGGNATVEIASDATLNKDTVTRNGNALTITGEGTYNLGSSIAADATLASDWTGTVAVSGVTFNSGTKIENLSNLGNANSTVQLSGATGYVNGNQDTTTTVTSNLKLVNGGTDDVALKITDGYSGNKLKVTGDVTGNGTIKVATTTGVDRLKYEFTGDVSQWEGDFIMADANEGSKTDEVIFSGTSDVKVNISSTSDTLKATFGGDSNTARTISSNISQDGGTVNMETSGTSGKNFTGNVSVDTATIGGGNVTMANLTTASTASVSTNLTVTGDATFGGLLTLGAAETLTVDGTLTVNGLELLTKIDVTGVQETVAYTIATAGALVGLDTITLDQVMTGTLAEGVTAEIVFGSAGRATGQDLALQLTYTPVTPPTPTELTVASAAWVGNALQVAIAGEIPASGELAVLVSGEMWETMMAEVTGAGESVSGAGVAFSLVTEGGTPIDMTNYSAVTFNGYAGDGNGNYAVIFIPEPTTATLGLLALAGLAARRRRKH